MEKAGIRDVIQQMMDVEQQAQEIVSAAETEAQNLLVRAREQAERSVDEAHHRATEQARASFNRAVEEAQRRRAEEIRLQLAQDAPVVAAARANLRKALDLIAREVAPGS